MQHHHVMRLGPMDKPDGQFFEYIVFPGIDGQCQFYGARDADALDLILEVYDAQTLMCEPALAQVADSLGLATQPLTQVAAHGLGLFAYDRIKGQPFSAITEEGMIYTFAQEVQQARELISKNPTQPARLWLHISGAVELETEILLAPDQPVPLTMLMEPARDTEAGDIEKLDRLWVEMRDAPDFIRDALSRAHGLDVIPVPWRQVQGRREPIADLQLAILIALWAACRDVISGAAPGQGEFSIREHVVSATLTRM